MLHIYCPYCEEHREETEFHYAGQAHIARPYDPDNTTDETWGNYLFFRKNPKGNHQEMWAHATGCRQYFSVVRNTLTYEILESYRIGEEATRGVDV